VASRQRNELIASADEKRIISNQKRGCSTFDQRCKSRIEIAVGAGPENLEPNSERLRRLLQVFCFGFGTWIARVDENPDHGGRRQQLPQHLQSLCPQHGKHQGHARDVAAWPVEAGDEAGFDRVEVAGDEDDGDGRGCGLGGERRDAATGRGNYRYAAGNQIGRQRRELSYHSRALA